MASYAKVALIGYLGRDPELKYTPNGNAVCNFSVAATEKIGSEEVTTWFRISAWGRQGELCNEYLHKGSQVYIEGRIRLETYTDREGQNRASVEVNAREIQFLGRSGDNDAPRRAADSEDRQARREALSSRQELDDDVPF
jgi:single-strand DNA-binding protein